MRRLSFCGPVQSISFHDFDRTTKYSAHAEDLVGWAVPTYKALIRIKYSNLRHITVDRQIMRS